MKLLFSPPSLDDLIRLLRAWRLWVLAALAGALLGAAVYFIAPPPYRARATVNVDFNLEEAWPHEADRQQFFYLEREARKLREIAWSDAVMQAVADQDGNSSIGRLRDEKLHLSQPGEAGWHFFADDPDPARARSLASAWARIFAGQAQAGIAQSQNLNSFIEVTVTQAAELPVTRSMPLSAYLLAGALSAWFLGSFCILFINFSQPPQPRPQQRRSKRKSAGKRTSKRESRQSSIANRKSSIVNRKS